MSELEYSPGMEPEAEVIPRDEASMLSVDVKPGRKHVLGGVKNVVRVLAGIRAPEIDISNVSELPPRPPLQVACVLDCSGSMSGQPLEFAKRAVSKLIKHLRENDTLHFITYDTHARVIFRNGDLSEAGKESLKSQVLAVQTAGQTNLFGGLESAVNLFNEPVEEGDAYAEAQVRRIFLFSDGCVNVGVTDKGEIQRRVGEWATQGITVNSFGIGTHFDEPLMRGIAEAGKGKYTFLATAQDIPKLVSKSVHGLLDLFASEAVIDVRGVQHTTVSRLYGADDDNEGCSDQAIATPGLLVLGDLHRGSERRVLVELEVSVPGGAPDGTTFEAAEWTISFLRQGAQAQFSGRVELQMTSSRGSLGEECAAVRAAFAIQKAADLDLEISQHLAHNDRVRAKEAKQRQMTLLKESLEVVRRDANAQSQTQALERVLVRAERVAEQIDRGDDSERVRRQCIQEMEFNRCMSDDGWRSGCDSDAGDVANLRDVASPPSSPRSSGSDSSRSPPVTPRLLPGFRNSRRTNSGMLGDNDSDTDVDNSPCKPALLFFGPPNDAQLVQTLLPKLECFFDVTHVDQAADGVHAVEKQRFHACVAKLGTDIGNLGEDVIKALRVNQGTEPFIAVHSATASRNPEMQFKLEEEYGVNLFVAHGQENELIAALKSFTSARGLSDDRGNASEERSTCLIA